MQRFNQILIQCPVFMDFRIGLMNFIRDSVSDVFNDFLGLCFHQNVGHIQVNHIVLIQMLYMKDPLLSNIRQTIPANHTFYHNTHTAFGRHRIFQICAAS